MPKISVIMPTYNAETYVREAIESILNQTFADFEFLILDGGSKDKTIEIIESYNDDRIKIYKNCGTTKRLNLDYELIKTPECIIAHFKYNKINIGYFMRDFKKIANNRGETLTKKVRPYYRNSSCVVPFQHLYIDYTGDVMLCCNMRHDIQAHQNFILGNAFNETLANIFMGNKIIEYRKLLACNGKKIHPCYSCSFTASTEKMNLIEAPLNN